MEVDKNCSLVKYFIRNRITSNTIIARYLYINYYCLCVRPNQPIELLLRRGSKSSASDFSLSLATGKKNSVIRICRIINHKSFKINVICMLKKGRFLTGQYMFWSRYLWIMAILTMYMFPIRSHMYKNIDISIFLF